MGKAGPGYRKPKTKKYFTKKDIISTSIIVAIVIVAIIVLGIVISRDDFIRIKDGKLEMEPNWLISNYSDNNTYMYYKVGEIGEVEGYTLTEGSAQSPIKALTADDENADVTSIYLGTFEHNYKTVAKSMTEFYKETTGPVDITVNGHDAQYITSFAAATAPAEETEEAAEDTEVTAEGEEAPAEDTEAPAGNEEVSTEDTEASADETEGVEAVSDEDLWLMVTYIDYDEDHSIYIQFNATRELTTEEATAMLDKITSQLTIVER